MSLEMMVYISLAGISMLYSIHAVSAYHQRSSQSISGYEYSNFVEAINTAILGNYSSISLYVPQGMCGGSLNGSSIDTGIGRLYFVETVRISATLACSPGLQRANLSYHQGYATIE